MVGEYSAVKRCRWLYESLFHGWVCYKQRFYGIKKPMLYPYLGGLIGKASPEFVEPKAYMHVGFSRLHLGFENMPSHREIRTFADKLAEETGYKVLDEAPESRLVLLSRLKKPKKLA